MFTVKDKDGDSTCAFGESLIPFTNYAIRLKRKGKKFCDSAYH